MDRVFKSKINECVESQVKKTDFQAMWSKIEREVAYRKSVTHSENYKKSGNGKRVAAGIAFACAMFVAIPAFAGVTMNWNKIVGFAGIENALNNGYGQRYEQKTTSSGVTMAFHALVTDGETMKALVSFDGEYDMNGFDAYQLAGSRIADDEGNAAPAKGSLYYDGESKRLLGILETDDFLQKSEKKLSLSAEKLIFFKYKKIPFKQALQAGDSVHTGNADFPEIYVQSLRQDGDRLIIRYLLTSASPEPEQLDPHLILGSTDSRGELTILKHDGGGLLVQQVFDNPVGEQPDAASFGFRYLDEEKTTKGDWSLSFSANGKQASKALYTRTLESGKELRELAGITLEKLSVTPQKILLNMEEDRSMERFRSGSVWYDSVVLVVGDKEIRGGFNLYEDSNEGFQHAYEFDSSVWFENWNEVPMKLVLKDAKVTKRDTSNHWKKLNPPTEAKQNTEMTLDNYSINFCYYLDGSDLIVESWSDSPGFQGIRQSMLRVKGLEIYPDISSADPFYTGKKVERYKGGADFEDIMLNPGFYSYSDPGMDMEIELK